MPHAVGGATNGRGGTLGACVRCFAGDGFSGVFDMQIRSTLLRCFVLSALFGAVAVGGPLGSGFTDGAIRAAGFPTPLVQMTLNGVSRKSGSGGGSTGGGFGAFQDRFPVGTASAGIQIIDEPGLVTVAIDGTANHNIDDGFTAAWSQLPIVLEITKSVPFFITNESGTWSGSWILTEPVTLEAITGAIITGGGQTGVLQAGTYRISFAAAAGKMNSFEAQQTVAPWYGWAGSDRIYSTEVHWKLKLSDLSQYWLDSGTHETEYYVQGQSFTPSIKGDFGPAARPASTPALLRLTQFWIDFNDTPPDQLFIYTSPPTPDEAASGTGSIATGMHWGNGVYGFNNVVLAYGMKYYAVLPRAANIRDGSGDTYPGGVDMFIRNDFNPPRVGEGYGDYDIGFVASFDYVEGCPADINLDGFVDDSDFVIFVQGYNALLCSAPEMLALGCPANLNTDLVVDDEDFVIFVGAYNELVCP